MLLKNKANEIPNRINLEQFEGAVEGVNNEWDSFQKQSKNRRLLNNLTKSAKLVSSI